MSPANVHSSLTQEILKRAPQTQRVLGNLLLRKEGANGRAEITFLQDTLVALGPKALVSRSPTELSEVGFLELLESLVIYFLSPWGAKKCFYPLFGRLLPKAPGIQKTDLLKPIKQLEHLPADKLMPILVSKGAIILSALTLTGIGGEYAINYAKNLMTARIFKKDKFSDVVNLSKGEMAFGQESPVVEKAKRRLYQTLGVCGGIFGASLMGAVCLPKMLRRLSPETLKDVVDGPLRSIVGFFDFRYKNGAYGLTKRQMGTYMAISIPAYLDSARDRLEKWESATRLGIVLPYLLWGQDKLEQFPLFKGIFERSSIMKTVEGGRCVVKDLEEVGTETVQKAFSDYLKKYPQKASEFALQIATPDSASSAVKLPADISKLPEEVLEAAAKQFRSPLNAKIVHVGVPLTVGVLGAGIGVGLLNRYWTKYRFDKQAQSMPVQVNTLSTTPASPQPKSLPQFQSYPQSSFTPFGQVPMYPALYHPAGQVAPGLMGNPVVPQQRSR